MRRIGVWVAATLIAATWIGCNQPTTPSGSTPAAATSAGGKDASVAGKKIAPATEDTSGYVQVKLSVPNMT